MKNQILFITSYPPRECGIATYSQDLIKAINDKFRDSFSLKVCALEAGVSHFAYSDEVKLVLNTHDADQYALTAQAINADRRVNLVVIQHEFGFFQQAGIDAFLPFVQRLTKQTIIVFHTVLPGPDAARRGYVQLVADACAFVVVMTQSSADILRTDYAISEHKIIVIAHGTHLVSHLNKAVLKQKYGLEGRKILSTFGLLSSGKSIETTLSALPDIVKHNPAVLFLIIGKTHPDIVASEGERYRNMLQETVDRSGLNEYVRFINRYLPLQDLLEYLQLTDIYLFTSKDPNQAVSGTFSYAMSCACPIISTPIPHAREMLCGDTGIIIDFQHAPQLAAAVNRLMGDEPLRTAFSYSVLQRVVPTVWENSAIAHALLFQKIAANANVDKAPRENTNAIGPQTQTISLAYRLPELNLEHVKKMTTDVGMIQFSNINQPDPGSGYTLDDNARALIGVCMHYELTGADDNLRYIGIYLNFIARCQQSDGAFLNYIDEHLQFTPQNRETNLQDANGRAIWSLGYLLSRRALLPARLVLLAESILKNAMQSIGTMHSTRAMAFVLKGLYYANTDRKSVEYSDAIVVLANRLVQMFRHESEPDWPWYEHYLTYANSILPEALLCAYIDSGDPVYKSVAKTSFDFLLSLTFKEGGIKVISNKTWLKKNRRQAEYGEQPIDVAYTILALSTFYKVFNDAEYLNKMETAFNWFLGGNHLHQIVYNPCTGGCYDGLEETHINLNQGAESTLCYLMARLTVEKHFTCFPDVAFAAFLVS